MSFHFIQCICGRLSTTWRRNHLRVFGMLEVARERRRPRLKLVKWRSRRRPPGTYFGGIQNVKPGSEIISECLRAYQNLHLRSYIHYQMNHQRFFVHPQTREFSHSTLSVHGTPTKTLCTDTWVTFQSTHRGGFCILLSGATHLEYNIDMDQMAVYYMTFERCTRCNPNTLHVCINIALTCC